MKVLFNGQHCVLVQEKFRGLLLQPILGTPDDQFFVPWGHNGLVLDPDPGEAVMLDALSIPLDATTPAVEPTTLGHKPSMYSQAMAARAAQPSRTLPGSVVPDDQA